MSALEKRPLLTFAVAAFNQERFIREAVEAAFAQTYSPLEIVLSDDCSEDRTFEIMRELAAAYRGPHRVILNRNPVRRSIGGHVNKVIEISRGELIVGAAGDDVSLPQRTQLVFEAWERSGRRATSLHSSIVQVDENGGKIGEIFKTEFQGESGQGEQRADPLSYVQTLEPLVFGCAHAYSRQLFSVFGNLPEEVIHEDNALVFRSILAGRIVYIDQALVKYRLHGNNVFITSRKPSADLKIIQGQEARLRRGFKNRETMYAVFLMDLETARARGLIGQTEFQRASDAATRLRDRVSLMGKYLESGFFGKCRIFSRLWRGGLEKYELKTLSRRLIPGALFVRLRLARAYAGLVLNRSQTVGNHE
jgi:glycosyltransferase involved in cell wall biosynthesis